MTEITGGINNEGAKGSIRIEPFESLKRIEPDSVADGAEKDVYKTTDGQRLIAAKILKDIHESGDSIDKLLCATEEFSAYTSRQ